MWQWHEHLIKKSPHKEARRYMESIRRRDKLGGNTFCSEMERCGGKEIMAERFKASTKKINQNLADAIVSAQTGCRTYQVEQRCEQRRAALLHTRRRNTGTRTITLMTNVRTGGGTTGPDTLQMRLLRDQTFIRIFSHLLQIMIPRVADFTYLYL